MKTTRAPKGGTVGKNGLFYSGGEFLPRTELYPMAKAEKRMGTGRVEIEPRVWVAAEGRKSIYKHIAGVFGKVEGEKMIIRCSEQTLGYFGETKERVETLAAKYNNGERWM